MSKNSEIEVLEKLYSNMKDVNFIKNKTKDEINSLNDDFNDKIKKLKNDKDTNIDIDNYKNEICEGRSRNSILKLFNEQLNPNEFNESIQEKTYDNLKGIITCIKNIQNDKNYIFKAKYENKPCFIKIIAVINDSPNDDGEKFLYEQKIYRYIKNRNEKLKPYYEDYFIKLYDVIKINYENLKKLLKPSSSSSSSSSQINLDKLMKTKGIDIEYLIQTRGERNTNRLLSNIFFYAIITEDIQGQKYEDFFRSNIHNQDLIIETLFDMIYGIYLMNDRLKIMHNDNHFNNVMIKTFGRSNPVKYQINKIEYVRNKNYRLCFYDFDLSYLEDFNNPFLPSDNSWIIQNKKSLKDIWTLINSISYNILNTFNIKCENKMKNILEKHKTPIIVPELDFLFYFINQIILNNNDEYIDKYINHILNYEKNYNYWNSYCENENYNDNNCKIPDVDTDYSAIEVLDRFIKDPKYDNIIKLLNVNSLYKKYKMYKLKYLNLKKSSS